MSWSTTNKLALNAGWDEALLCVEMADLRGMAFDLSLVGFGEAEQAALLDKTDGLTDPDDAPAAPEHPVTQIAPGYGMLAVKRWQAFAGRAAVVDGDGRNFDAIAAERMP